MVNAALILFIDNISTSTPHKKQGRKLPLICIKCNKRVTFGKRKREKERERDWERERKKKRDSFGILYTGYLLSIVKIKREI